MSNKKIQTTELDFDDIKNNLKVFLQGQSEFQDYDFEGSALSVLLDVLAYNTHYNSLYTNLAVNEAFLDSASKRSSVVSRAKELGYVPYSATSAAAIVNVIVSSTTSLPVILQLPAFSSFVATVNGVQYNFYTNEVYTADLDATTNTYTFSNVLIKEGTPLTYRFTVQDGARYVIPNNNVDISSLKVRVQESATSSNYETYVREESILTLDGTSQVYFVKEIDDQLYELEFGNDVIGKQLSNGNVINLTYMISNKDAANGSSTFSYQGASLLGGTVSVVTTSPASGGTDVEPIESIRYNAPRSYTAQNRAVTVEDYRAVLYKRYPEAEAINVWGGESNIPKQYGKVFISIKPKSTSVLTDTQKSYIINEILKSNNVVSITPEIVDPEYINIQVDSTVYYNPKITTKSAEDIKDIAISAIKNYNDTSLNSFTGVLKHSKLSSAIDSSDVAITSNITNIKLCRSFNPVFNQLYTYTIELGNPIYGSGVPEQAILSTGIYIYGRTELMYWEDLPIDTTYGLMRLFYYDEAGSKTYYKTYGTETSPTVNYKTGTIILPEVYITGLDLTGRDTGEFIIKPQSNDAVSIRNQLVTIPDNKITVNVIADTSFGDSTGGSSYVFTSSRT